MIRTRWWWLGASLALMACDDEELYPEGEFVLTEGHETGTWTADPPAVRAEIDRILADGTREPFTTRDAAPTRFFMGSDGIAAFEITGYDAADEPRVWGRSFPMDTSTLWGYVLPLFVGRTGEFSRPPGEFQLDHGSSPPVAQLGGRWIVAAGDSEDGMVLTEAYDLARWIPGASPELRCPDENAPCNIATLAVVDFAIVIAVGENFLRTYLYREADGVLTVEFADSNLPEGLNEWSEVAGGSVIEAPDGDVYVVGATRSDPPTTAVLRIVPGDADSAEVALRTAHLQTARAGASATWVEGRGLVVVGGSAEGAGAEVLNEGGTEFVALPFPADPVAGSALAGLGSDSLVRVGGRDPEDQPAATVTLSLTCDLDCVTEALREAVDLREATAYELSDGTVLAIGLGPDGVTAAARLDQETTQSVALQEPRRGASSLRVSTGHIAVVGGVDADGGFVSTVELFAP